MKELNDQRGGGRVIFKNDQQLVVGVEEMQQHASKVF